MNRWMKIWWMPLAVLTAMGQVPGPGGSATGEGLLERGLAAEEATGDLHAAKASYAEALAKADAGRGAHASTLFRLAEVRRRLGETDAAAGLYRRLLSEFADQAELVAVARTRLAALGGGGARGAGIGAAGSGLPGAMSGGLGGGLATTVGSGGGAGFSGAATSVSSAGTDPLLNLRIEAARQRWLRLEEARTELILKRLNLELRRKELVATSDGVPDEVRRNHPSEAILSLDKNLRLTESNLADARRQYGPDHPETRKFDAVRNTIKEQLNLAVGEDVSRRLKSMQAEDEALRASIDSYAKEAAMVQKELELELGHAAPHASVTPVASAGGNPSAASRFLDEEIQVAEEQLAIAMKSFEAGRAGQEEVLKARREVLALRRQRASSRPDLTEVIPTPAKITGGGASSAAPSKPSSDPNRPKF